MYKREGQNGLAFRCEVSHGNCERSASALLSLSRVLRLKRTELLGQRYAAAIVARHDLLFARDFRLPPHFRRRPADARAPERVFWQVRRSLAKITQNGC